MCHWFEEKEMGLMLLESYVIYFKKDLTCALGAYSDVTTVQKCYIWEIRFLALFKVSIIMIGFLK